MQGVKRTTNNLKPPPIIVLCTEYIVQQKKKPFPSSFADLEKNKILNQQ